MNRDDFYKWLDRPLTNTDVEIVEKLVTMIKDYDRNIEEKVFLIKQIDEIKKILDYKKEGIKEDIEVLK